MRLDAAKVALPYEKPRLAVIAGNVDDRFRLAQVIERIAEEAHLARLEERGPLIEAQGLEREA